MAKAKKSMVEKQQSADVAEQAHRLAHELGWHMDIHIQRKMIMHKFWKMEARMTTQRDMVITIRILKQFPIVWQELLAISKQ